MNPNPAAVLFDFGGVLIEWDPFNLYLPYFRNDRKAVQRFLDEISFSEWNMKQDAGRPFKEAVDELSARFPDYADMIRLYDEGWEKSIIGPNWSTVSILRQLHEKDVSLYALSNWSDEKFQLIRPRYDFFDLFKDILISGAVGMIKPDPRIFHLALERIGRSASQVLLIDDSLVNIQTARQLGFQTVLFQSPSQLQQELEVRGFL